MTDKRRTAFSAALLVIVLTLSLPAAAEEGDRFEAYNRAVHGMNAAVYRTVLNPLAVYYQQNVPPPVRQGVANFFANLMEPMTVAYSLALGDTDNAGNAANRFVINTFTGLAGVRDPAGERGVKSRRVHFSEVLCLYGVPNGDYVVLPILGPSTIRPPAAGT
ncbi:MAG: VacJ family lipoprotein, partial [Rhodospirillales bacterium]|nr:VacJ family lipoprotein [Rhodospirillales bacterium]